jgi:hypothetical protein
MIITTPDNYIISIEYDTSKLGYVVIQKDGGTGTCINVWSAPNYDQAMRLARKIAA